MDRVPHLVSDNVYSAVIQYLWCSLILKWQLWKKKKKYAYYFPTIAHLYNQIMKGKNVTELYGYTNYEKGC